MDGQISARIYEIEHSCSPGGVDCFAVEVGEFGGPDFVYREDFRSAPDALRWLISSYPATQLNLTVQTLAWYFTTEGIQ
jgi:hypothetical protein